VGDGAAEGSSARHVVDRMVRDGVDHLLYLGDVYETGTAREFARSYAPTFGRLARRTWPTPGNHDWANHRTGYDRYWRRANGKAISDHYRVSAGGWQIVSLNSESPHDAQSKQVAWLRRAVAGPGDCRIAFWHRPRYNAGEVHGDAPDVEPFWAALRGQARIVINGHEHDMQRFHPRDGIVEFVSGAGGYGLYRLRGHAGLAWGDDTHFGALRLSLRPGRARWAFVTEGGATLDSGTIACTRE
jgi:hypothetical protein